MNFDDEKTKIRRNLVLFCALYITGAYLGISVQEWASQLLQSKSGVAVQPHKLNVVAAAFLAYLAWRWFTSDEQREQFGAVVGGFKSRLEALMNEWAIRRTQIMLFNENLSFFSQHDKTRFDEWYAEVERRFDQRGKFTASVHSYLRTHFSGAWNMHLVTRDSDGTLTSQLHIRLKLKLPYLHRIILVVRSAIFVVFRQYFTDWLPPVVLSSTVAVVIVYRLIIFSFA